MATPNAHNTPDCSACWCCLLLPKSTWPKRVSCCCCCCCLNAGPIPSPRPSTPLRCAHLLACNVCRHHLDQHQYGGGGVQPTHVTLNHHTAGHNNNNTHRARGFDSTHIHMYTHMPTEMYSILDCWMWWVTHKHVAWSSQAGVTVNLSVKAAAASAKLPLASPVTCWQPWAQPVCEQGDQDTLTLCRLC